MLISQNAETGGVEHKMCAVDGLQRKPARSQHPEEVSTGKKQHVAIGSAYTLDHTIGARRYLAGGFAPRTTIAEQLPVGIDGEDVRSEPAFIVAVVPFHEIGIGDSGCAEASKFAGPHNAAEWAGGDARKINSGQSRTQFAGLNFTVLRKGEVGKPG